VDFAASIFRVKSSTVLGNGGIVPLTTWRHNPEDVDLKITIICVMFLRKYEGYLKVRVLTLLLRVGTLWRCGDGLFFEVPPLASDALLTTLHPLLENVMQTVDHFEISCLEAPFSWLEKSRNRIGQDLN
jgi:hypothetical protein